ncbi:MAG: PEP-CTERM sorting domain-containing protein [Phycisphaerales bacterium]|nr:PEP-CTERM sorting domain-containing protein [Phycisphaerales bacterium]
MKAKQLIIVGAILSGAMVGHSQASLLVYQGYEYATRGDLIRQGSPLAIDPVSWNGDGNTSAIGFTGSWGAQAFGSNNTAWDITTQLPTAPATSQFYSKVTAGTFTDLPQAWTSTGFTQVGRYAEGNQTTGVRYNNLKLSTPILDVEQSGVLYVSFLLRTGTDLSLPSPSTHIDVVSFRLGSISADGFNSSKLHFGFTKDKIAIGQGFTPGTPGEIEANTTYFFTAKVTTQAGNDTVQAKLYKGTTALDTSEPISWDVSRNFEILATPASGGSLINTFSTAINTNFGAGIDEFRAGTTWASVTAIPEPASLSILGLAGLMMLTRRR